MCDIQYSVTEGVMHFMESADILKNLTLELRRGTLLLCVLSQLKQARYGYSLLQHLSEQGIDIDQNTLYPLLRRLEQQGLLSSDWSLEESRPRRYYVLSDLGAEVLKQLTDQWHQMAKTITQLLNSEGE